MFERFTGTARRAVVEAQAQATALGHDAITSEHLLLGILADPGSVPSTVLADLGVDHQRLVREVATLGDADAAALAAIGVDLESVRRRAERTFGAGALDRPRRRRLGLFGR